MCEYGSLVKRLRRRPLTAETGVRFPYELLIPKVKTFGIFFNQSKQRFRRRGRSHSVLCERKEYGE